MNVSEPSVRTCKARGDLTHLGLTTESAENSGQLITTRLLLPPQSVEPQDEVDVPTKKTINAPGKLDVPLSDRDRSVFPFTIVSMNAGAYPGEGLSLSEIIFALNEELRRTAFSPPCVMKDRQRLG